MYLVFRSIQGRSFGPDEALLNAIDALKSAAIGRLDESRRRASIGLLVETGSSGALSDSVRDLLADVPALPARAPGWFTRTGEDFRSRYREFTKRHSFTIIVNTLLIIVAVVKVVTVVSLALDGRGVRGFAEWASVISSVVAGVLIVIGAFSLRRSKLAAYQWFERGLLVEILVTQVFVFAEEQLAGVIGLTYTIVLWLMVRSASRAEREREALADADVPRADTASPVSDPVS
jgi:hypothetical protein